MVKLDKIKSILNNILKELGGKKIALYLILLCVTVISITIITITHNRMELSKYALQAEKYFFTQEYDLAIEKYSELVELDKGSPKWNIKIAEVYSVKNDLVNSLKYIDISRKYETIDAKSYNSMVFTEFINGEYKAALKDGEIALSKYPKNKSLIKTMFTVYMGNEKVDSAIELMTKYPVDTKSSYDTSEYSRMLMLLGKWEEGYTLLKNAWEINKDEYKIYDVLAQVALYDKDALLQNITELSKKYPNELSYKMWLAKIYSLSADTSDQANKLIDEMQSKNVGTMQIELIKANVYKNMNELEKSDKLIQSVISKHPNDYRVCHSAGWYYLYKKDYEKAKEYCNKSIELNPEYPDNYGFLMPEILKGQSTKLAAEPYFRTALVKEPYNYNIMINLANYYWYNADDSSKALEYYNLASIIKPRDAEIKYNMALIKLADGEVEDAIKILKSCSKLNELVSKYHRTLATIYMTKNNQVQAKIEIDAAYLADEDDILTLNNAGCYYINFNQDLQKGFYNISKAYQGLNDSYDDYTKKIIVDNYDKVLKLKESYTKGKDNEELKIPEFTLFY